jgi:hypothetical protein
MNIPFEGCWDMLLRCMAWRGCMQRPNRLAGEKSPYLLQHAYNPVDWYPWGEEAFRKAREENKPIFLSIRILLMPLVPCYGA